MVKMSELSNATIQDFQRLDDQLDALDQAIERLPLLSHFRARGRLGKRREKIVDETVSEIMVHYRDVLRHQLAQSASTAKALNYARAQEYMDDLDREILEKKNASVLKFMDVVRDNIVSVRDKREKNVEYIRSQFDQGKISESVMQDSIADFDELAFEFITLTKAALRASIKKQQEIMMKTLNIPDS